MIEGHDGSSSKGPMGDEDEDDDAGDDPLRNAFSGRGDPDSFAHPFRALGGFMSGSSAAHRIRELLGQLQKKDDPSAQVIALTELAQFLLVSNEDNLSGNIPTDQLVKSLVTLMQPNEFGDENPEMMLLACRCIANLIEASPSATRNVVQSGAVTILCQKLFEINYIDLAEQALSTLEKISVDYGGSIIEAGGLTACLNYLDFFATSTQRSAVTTAANCCRNIPSGSFAVIRDVMPVLLNVLGSNDQRVVEQGSLCVSRIVENFRDRQEKLEELVKPEMLKAILRLLVPGTTNLIGPNIHTQFLRVLAITARASPKLAAELLRMDVVDTLYQILTGVSPAEDTEGSAAMNDGVMIMQALIHRPREQIYETLNVVCELLPSAQEDQISIEDRILEGGMFGDELVGLASGRNGNSQRQERLDMLSKCQDKVKRFVTILLPTLVHAYSSTVNLSVRRKVLSAQLKMLSNIDVAILEDAIRSVPFASYLASMLSQQDHPTLSLAALQAAELLSTRLGSIYIYQFCREGVIAEIKKLASQPLAAQPERKKERKPPVKVDEAARPVEKAESPREPSVSEDYDVSDSEAEAIARELDEADGGDDDENGDGDHLVIHEDMSRSPSTSSSDGNGYRGPSFQQTLKDCVTVQAQRFLERHQTPSNQQIWDKAYGILEGVKALGQKLRGWYQKADQAEGGSLFEELASYFGNDTLKSITSAELLNSGIIDDLLDVFEGQNGECLSEPLLRSLTPLTDSLNFDAKEALAEKFMRGQPLNLDKDASAGSNSTPFGILVYKLQDLLSRCEHFEVLTVNLNSSIDVGRSNPSSMLSKQIRLKLVADEDSDIPRPYRHIMVSIHAIATFKALDDYLRPRMSLASRSRSGRGPDGLPASLAAFAAASGMSPHHRRLLDSAMGGMPEPSQPPPPPVEPTPKSSSRKSSKDKLATNSQPAAPEAEATPTKRTSRRHHKTSTPAAPPPPPPAPPVESSEELLECADERQLSEEDEIDDPGALDALVDDLEEGMERTPTQDPSAVNLEVASTGKVTAREENGARVPTPSQNAGLPLPMTATPTPAPRLPPSMSGHAKAMSYAAAIQSIPQDWHIEFSIGDRPVPGSTTIYQAVHGPIPDDMTSRHVWSAAHTVNFKKVAGPPPAEGSIAKQTPEAVKPTGEDGLPASLHEHPTTSKILRLLNLLHELNVNTEDIVGSKEDQNLTTEPLTQFVNTKLTAKLNRQLEEPLIVASRCLPQWSQDLPCFYPFLFPFETRHLFLQSTSFGYARSMMRWQNAQAADDSRRDRHRDDRPSIGRLQRQRVRISRTRILESALKVMELYSSSPSVLEVEYFEEVGTGLGPTLEFYSSVSKEFCKKKNHLWRADDSNGQDPYAFGRQGLFPAPMSTKQAASDAGKRALHLFRMLGKFVARSMLDSRITDISFNPLFFKIGGPAAGGGRRYPLSLRTVRAVDAGLASSLRVVWHFVQSTKVLDAADARLDAATKARLAENIHFENVSLEDLGLDFTLPGYPNIELVESGANVPVTIANVGEYLDAVIDMTVGSGVQRQIDEFRAGFSSVFSYSALNAFTPAELVMLFGTVEEDWSIESKTCPHLLHLVEEMANMSQQPSWTPSRPTMAITWTARASRTCFRS